MFDMSPLSLMLIITFSLFAIGMLTFISGVLTLTFRTNNSDVKSLANRTTQLAQKGIAQDVAGLVGNASTLLDATNQMVRTTAGVGVFLTILGLILMGASTWLALKIFQFNL